MNAPTTPHGTTLHLFELDGVLLETDARVWVIDRDRPSKPLKRVPLREYNVWQRAPRSEDPIIEYNGRSHRIPKAMVESLTSDSRPEERLGVSFVEFTDLSRKRNITYLMNNVRHLAFRPSELGVLTRREGREEHSGLLNDLREEISAYGLQIDRVHFVSERFEPSETPTTSYAKLNVLLEYLVGFKIKGDRFAPIQTDRWPEVIYYDSEPATIALVDEAQNQLEGLLSNTDDEVHSRILEIVSKKRPVLEVRWVSGNEINPFEGRKVVLRPPSKYPLVRESVVPFSEFEGERCILCGKESDGPWCPGCLGEEK